MQGIVKALYAPASASTGAVWHWLWYLLCFFLGLQRFFVMYCCVKRIFL